jgi:hypothetical protein
MKLINKNKVLYSLNKKLKDLKRIENRFEGFPVFYTTKGRINELTLVIEIIENMEVIEYEK